MQSHYFYRLIIFGKPACGCLSFDNPILKTEYKTHITYIFPSCHDMDLVWRRKFLSAICSSHNLIPYDMTVEKICLVAGNFQFEKMSYQPDWRTLVERYTYRDENAGIHLNRTLLDELGR